MAYLAESASAWLAKLKKEGVITSSGVGRGVRYQLAVLADVRQVHERAGLNERIGYGANRSRRI